MPITLGGNEKRPSSLPPQTGNPSPPQTSSWGHMSVCAVGGAAFFGLLAMAIMESEQLNKSKAPFYHEHTASSPYAILAAMVTGAVLGAFWGTGEEDPKSG